MATKTLKQIKEETGRNLDDLTEDNDNVFVETAAGSAGVSTIFKMLSRRIHNVLSGLTALASGTDTDYAVIVRNGTAQKITLNNLADYVMASGQDASVDSLTVTGSANFGGTVSGSGVNALLSDYVKTTDLITYKQELRKVFNLSGAGWYRIAYTKNTNVARTAQSETVLISLSSMFNNSENMNLYLSMGIAWRNVVFTKLSSAIPTSNTKVINGVRYTYNATKSEGYIDVHYTFNTQNTMILKLESPYFVLSTFAKVADTPTDEIIYGSLSV